MAKRKFLALQDITQDFIIINLEHVDYIRTDLRQLRVKFAAEEHESKFDVTINTDDIREFMKQVGD